MGDKPIGSKCLLEVYCESIADNVFTTREQDFVLRIGRTAKGNVGNCRQRVSVLGVAGGGVRVQ